MDDEDPPPPPVAEGPGIDGEADAEEDVDTGGGGGVMAGGGGVGLDGTGKLTVLGMDISMAVLAARAVPIWGAYGLYPSSAAVDFSISLTRLTICIGKAMHAWGGEMQNDQLKREFELALLEDYTLPLVWLHRLLHQIVWGPHVSFLFLLPPSSSELYHQPHIIYIIHTH